jgi:hypothetical protein
MESDTLREEVQRYGALYTKARKTYMTRAYEATPANARLHDNGITWTRYHEGVFQAVNPAPDVIRAHTLSGGHLPENFNTTWEWTNLRRDLIGYNNLRPIGNTYQLKQFFI